MRHFSKPMVSAMVLAALNRGLGKNFSFAKAWTWSAQGLGITIRAKAYMPAVACKVVLLQGRFFLASLRESFFAAMW